MPKPPEATDEAVVPGLDKVELKAELLDAVKLPAVPELFADAVPDAKGEELLGFKVFTVDVTLFEAVPSAFFDDKSELLLTDEP